MSENWTVEELAEQMKVNPDFAKVNQVSHPIASKEEIDRAVRDSMTTVGQGSYVKTAKKRGYNKYRVAPKEDRTYNGVVYRSKKEAEFAQQLDFRKQSGEISFWLYEVPFRLPGGTKYLLDFMTFKRKGFIQGNVTVNQNAHDVEFIEVKGKLRRKGKNGKYYERELELGRTKRKQTEEIYKIHIEVI